MKRSDVKKLTLTKETVGRLSDARTALPAWKLTGATECFWSGCVIK